MVEILVRGEAVERATAERASVTVRSRWEAESPEQARELVAKAHARVVADARAFVDDGAAESWHADAVWVSHHEEWMGEGQPRRVVFGAASSATVRFIDFDALGAWTTDLAAESVHDIDGVVWSLAEDTERRLASSVRAAALADAIARAEDYARAAGLGAPTITSIREPGVGDAVPVAAKAERAMARSAMAADVPSIELEPGDIRVPAAVEVAFSAPSASERAPVRD